MLYIRDKIKKINDISEKNTRNSSIELLKIIGILLIVISHVVQTLHESNIYIDYKDYIINLCLATKNIQYLILSMLQYSGTIGNTIFFVCSAYFLLDSKKSNKRKILQMLMDIWIISVIIFIPVYILRRGDIGIKMIIHQLFPTLFGNNWYMTCYLLFYSIYPFLNIIIEKVNKLTLFRITLIMLFLYFGINFLHTGYFYISDFILWIGIYFTIAYMKLYLVDISNNIKLNIIIVLIGFIINYTIIGVTNILGLHFSFFSDKLFRWNRNNPFILMMVIGFFNIVRNINFKNNIINYLSKLSMLIYIIHENMLLRIYYRPMLWEYVYVNYGYRYILVWTFILVIIVFLFGLILSIIYKCTIQKLVIKIGDILYPKLKSRYYKIENLLLKLR